LMFLEDFTEAGVEVVRKGWKPSLSGYIEAMAGDCEDCDDKDCCDEYEAFENASMGFLSVATGMREAVNALAPDGMSDHDKFLFGQALLIDFVEIASEVVSGWDNAN